MSDLMPCDVVRFTREYEHGCEPESAFYYVPEGTLATVVSTDEDDFIVLIDGELVTLYATWMLKKMTYMKRAPGLAPRHIVAKVDQILRDYYVKRIKWEKYQAPVSETWYCEACDTEADNEDEIDHMESCPIARWREMNPEYYGDQPA